MRLQLLVDNATWKASRTVAVDRRRRAQRAGMALIWVAMLLVALVGIVALAIDFGYAYWTSQKLQNVADAAALAGARQVYFSHDDARAQALAIAAENEAGERSIVLDSNVDNHPEGDVIIGNYDAATRTFTATLEDGETNAVAVNARLTEDSENGPLGLTWGSMFGRDTTQITRWAIAVCEDAPAGPGIILLKSSGIGLQHSGNGTVTINGSVQINSTYKEALHQSGSGTIQSDSYEVVGQIYDSKAGGLPGEWNEGVDPVPDPYATLPVPVLSEHVVRSTSKVSRGSGTHTFQPGRYKGGMDLGDGTYTLQPGIYIMEGGGFKLGSGTLIADEVMIYNCGTNGGTSNADQFYISGDATVDWTPVTGGTYAGFGLFQHRSVADKKVEISGNGDVNISAIIYAKSGEVQLSGNGSTQMLGGGFVAASMQISGDGSFKVGGDSATGPGGELVYLVE